VTYVDILAEDTVDEKIVKSLRKKINIASKVMDGELYDQQPNDEGGDLEVIFKNGKMVRKTSWNDVRMRAML